MRVLCVDDHAQRLINVAYSFTAEADSTRMAPVMCSLGFNAHNQDSHKLVLLIKQVVGERPVLYIYIILRRQE